MSIIMLHYHPLYINYLLFYSILLININEKVCFLYVFNEK